MHVDRAVAASICPCLAPDVWSLSSDPCTTISTIILQYHQSYWQAKSLVSLNISRLHFTHRFPSPNGFGHKKKKMKKKFTKTLSLRNELPPDTKLSENVYIYIYIYFWQKRIRHFYFGLTTLSHILSEEWRTKFDCEQMVSSMSACNGLRERWFANYIMETDMML